MEGMRIEVEYTGNKPDLGLLAGWILKKMKEEVVRTDAEAGELDQAGLQGAVSLTYCLAGG